MAMRKK